MGLFISTYTNQEKGVKSSDPKHQLKRFKCYSADCDPLVLPLSWWLCLEAQKSSLCLATVLFSHKLEAGGDLEDLRWRLPLLICCREVFECTTRCCWTKYNAFALFFSFLTSFSLAGAHRGCTYGQRQGPPLDAP